MTRYNRHIVLSEVGQEGQQKIGKAKVLVIGAGGLGCPVLQYLVAAGVGTIGIVDFDIVEESNLQRQILFGTSSMGKNKAIAAKTKLEDLNPTISIIAYPEMLNPKNVLQLFTDYDIIVDGSDNFETRYLINDAALLLDKPLVYGAIYKFEGQVCVFNYKKGPTYRCLFPNPPKPGEVPNCSEIGVLGVLPGIIGSMQANEVLKIILNLGDVLSGKLLCYDVKTADSQMVRIKRNEQEVEKIIKQKDLMENRSFNLACTPHNVEIDIQQLSTFKDIQYLDVRGAFENPKPNLDGLLQIPLQELNSRLDELPNDKAIVVFCQSGMRSKKAVDILRKNNYQNSYSLKQGAHELMHLNIEI